MQEEGTLGGARVSRGPSLGVIETSIEVGLGEQGAPEGDCASSLAAGTGYGSKQEE